VFGSGKLHPPPATPRGEGGRVPVVIRQTSARIWSDRRAARVARPLAIAGLFFNDLKEAATKENRPEMQYAAARVWSSPDPAEMGGGV